MKRKMAAILVGNGAQSVNLHRIGHWDYPSAREPHHCAPLGLPVASECSRR